MTQTLFISFIIYIYSFAKLSLVYFQCLQTEYMTTNKTERKLFSVYQYFSYSFDCLPQKHFGTLKHPLHFLVTPSKPIERQQVPNKAA